MPPKCRGPPSEDTIKRPRAQGPISRTHLPDVQWSGRFKPCRIVKPIRIVKLGRIIKPTRIVKTRRIFKPGRIVNPAELENSMLSEAEPTSMLDDDNSVDAEDGPGPGSIVEPLGITSHF